MYQTKGGRGGRGGGAERISTSLFPPPACIHPLAPFFAASSLETCKQEYSNGISMTDGKKDWGE